MKDLISTIIPVYNEENSIGDCLKSLKNQTYGNLEIIVVDDGSTDKTLEMLSVLNSQFSTLKVLNQKHLGPGPARNLGAKHSKGQILVFVDADMTFDKNFIKDLTLPILKGKTIGSFSKNELVANKNNVWSICWNINRNVPANRMLPINFPNESPVFRAILKSQFEKVEGFDATGEYTDDWSLGRKLGIKSTLAKGALYFHSNPDNLKEVFKQARWIGRSKFISGSFIRKIKSLSFYSFPVSTTIAICKSLSNLNFHFLVFKAVYDLGVWISVVESFIQNKKFK